MHRSSLLSTLMAVSLTLAALGCDSSPTGPSSEFGASLNGRFRGQNASANAQRTVDSFYRAQSASEIIPTTVVVLDSEMHEITSVPIVNGRFSLRGLPENFYLLFLDQDGNQIGDPMHFTRAKPNQEIDIVVAMQDDGVVLVREKRTGIDHQAGSGIEIEGIANVISDDGDGVSGSLTVNGYTVITQITQTSIRKGNRNLTLADIDGKQVHVRGVVQEDGTVLAHEIKLQDDEEEEETEEEEDEEEKVTICHIPPGNPDNAKTITVGASAVDAHLAHGDTLGPCP